MHLTSTYRGLREERLEIVPVINLLDHVFEILVPVLVRLRLEIGHVVAEPSPFVAGLGGRDVNWERGLIET